VVDFGGKGRVNQGRHGGLDDDLEQVEEEVEVEEEAEVEAEVVGGRRI